MEKKEQSITERFLMDYLIKLCWQEKEVDMLIGRFLVVQERELDKAREEVFTKKELEVIEGWCYESLNLNESYPNIICEEAGTIKEKVSKLKQ